VKETLGMIDKEDLKIVAAAIQYNGKIYTGWRHANIMRAIWDELGELVYINQESQGFVDNNGKFWNRFQSCAIAHRAGQTHKCGYNITSEDLW
jgi:hypothetical protein